MIKEEIVANVSEHTGYSQAIVKNVVDSLLNNIVLELSRGNEVRFAKFGVFKPKVAKAKIGRNPHTNEEVPIPERIVPSFKPGSALKEAVVRDK